VGRLKPIRTINKRKCPRKRNFGSVVAHFRNSGIRPEALR